MEPVSVVVPAEQKASRRTTIYLDDTHTRLTRWKQSHMLLLLVMENDHPGEVAGHPNHDPTV